MSVGISHANHPVECDDAPVSVPHHPSPNTPIPDPNQINNQSIIGRLQQGREGLLRKLRQVFPPPLLLQPRPALPCVSLLRVFVIVSIGGKAGRWFYLSIHSTRQYVRYHDHTYAVGGRGVPQSDVKSLTCFGAWGHLNVCTVNDRTPQTYLHDQHTTTQHHNTTYYNTIQRSHARAGTGWRATTWASSSSMGRMAATTWPRHVRVCLFLECCAWCWILIVAGRSSPSLVPFQHTNHEPTQQTLHPSPQKQDAKKARGILSKACDEGIPDSCYALASHLLRTAPAGDVKHKRDPVQVGGFVWCCCVRMYVCTPPQAIANSIVYDHHRYDAINHINNHNHHITNRPRRCWRRAAPGATAPRASTSPSCTRRGTRACPSALIIGSVLSACCGARPYL